MARELSRPTFALIYIRSVGSLLVRLPRTASFQDLGVDVEELALLGLPEVALGGDSFRILSGAFGFFRVLKHPLDHAANFIQIPAFDAEAALLAYNKFFPGAKIRANDWQPGMHEMRKLNRILFAKRLRCFWHQNPGL